MHMHALHGKGSARCASATATWAAAVSILAAPYIPERTPRSLQLYFRNSFFLFLHKHRYKPKFSINELGLRRGLRRAHAPPVAVCDPSDPCWRWQLANRGRGCCWPMGAPLHLTPFRSISSFDRILLVYVDCGCRRASSVRSLDGKKLYGNCIRSYAMHTCLDD